MIKQKTILKASMWYFIFTMVFGALHGIITKRANFDGETVLSAIHSHLFSLGTLLFLVLFVLSVVNKKFLEDKTFSIFFIFYNLALPFMNIMLFIRGLVEVFRVDLSEAHNSLISGLSGVSHTFMAVVLAILFVNLFRFCKTLGK